MTYDFFNTSNLAFGSKLTAAFQSLNDLAKAAEQNLEQVFADQAIYNEYTNKNYQVPRPVDLGSPCRTDEIFDLLNDSDLFINTLEYSSGKVKVKVKLFNRNNNRMTAGIGETTLKEGYCYIKESVSNQNPDRELSFSEDRDSSLGSILFQYRVDSSNVVNIVGDVSNLRLTPLDIHQYSSLSKGSTVATTGSYTSNSYECVCIIGRKNNIKVRLNGTTVLQGQGADNVRCCILYLKPKDKITGTYNNIFRINYNH